MGSQYKNYQREFDSPATNAVAVTPHDSNQLTYYSRALYVGVGGNVVVILKDDSAEVTFANVASGQVLPVCAKIVKSTNTTATNIIALY